MGAEFNHSAMLEYANSVGVAHRGKSMRDQNVGRIFGRLEDAIENLALAAHIKLGRRLIEEHHSRA